MTQPNSTKKLYEEHHAELREPDFSILKDERGVFFAEQIGIGKDVLDIGCRDGALTSYFLKGNAVLGSDIDENSLQRAKEKEIDTMVMDLMGDWHELGGRTFDAIVAGELLEHLFYPERVVKKVKEHLKGDGMFIGSVPNAFSLKNRLRYLRGTTKYTPLSDPTHINQFSAHSLAELLHKEFNDVRVFGLGKHHHLAALYPNWFAFDLAFVAKNSVP